MFITIKNRTNVDAQVWTRYIAWLHSIRGLLPATRGTWKRKLKTIRLFDYIPCIVKTQRSCLLSTIEKIYAFYVIVPYKFLNMNVIFIYELVFGFNIVCYIIYPAWRMLRAQLNSYLPSHYIEIFTPYWFSVLWMIAYLGHLFAILKRMNGDIAHCNFNKQTPDELNLFSRMRNFSKRTMKSYNFICYTVLVSGRRKNRLHTDATKLRRDRDLQKPNCTVVMT